MARTEDIKIQKLFGGNSFDKSQRSSNIEILRIVAMLMIVAHHLIIHGTGTDSLTGNVYFEKFFIMGGKIAVDIFVIISGFFLINSKFKMKKVIALVLQTAFYNVLIYAILASAGFMEFTAKSFALAFFPIGSNAYWFFTCYALLYLAFPFINLALNHCKKKTHILLMIFLLVIQSIYPIIFKTNFLSNFGGFVSLYVIGAYLKLYPPKLFKNQYIVGGWLFFLWAATYSIYAVADISIWGKDSPMAIAIAVLMFCFANNLEVKNSKFINAVSGTTFGVYLIHDNSFIRPLLWRVWLKCEFHANLKYFAVYALAVILLVFVVCAIIEYVREKTSALCRLGINKLRSKIYAEVGK